MLALVLLVICEQPVLGVQCRSQTRANRPFDMHVSLLSALSLSLYIGIVECVGLCCMQAVRYMSGVADGRVINGTNVVRWKS